MARKKIAIEEIRENSKKLKKIVTIIIFIIMLATLACYALGLDKYIHPKPQNDPEVSAWGTNEETSDTNVDDEFDFESAKENEGESLQDQTSEGIVTDPYKDTVTTEAISEDSEEVTSEEISEEQTKEE